MQMSMSRASCIQRLVKKGALVVLDPLFLETLTHFSCVAAVNLKRRNVLKHLSDLMVQLKARYVSCQ